MRIASSTAALLALLLAVSCGDREPASSRAFQEAEAAMLGEDTPDDARLQAIRDYLAKYPDTEHTSELLDTGLYCALDKNNDADAAFALVDTLATRVKNPATQRDVRVQRARVLAAQGKADGVARAAVEMKQDPNLSYDHRYAVASACARAGVWDPAIFFAESALERATPAAVKADYAGSNLTEEKAGQVAARRASAALTLKGWALFNLEKPEESRAAFEAAREQTRFNYVGVPSTDLNKFQARALLKQGRIPEAVELLIPEAVYGEDKDAIGLLNEAHAASGETLPYADWVAGLRARDAKTPGDFLLAGYDGGERAFSTLKGKVTLLTFWFPS